MKSRIRPDGKAEMGNVRVVNKTSNSIMVQLDKDGTLKIIDCCLEEQGK